MNEILTEEELGARLKKAPRTIRDWREKRMLPFIRIGRSILYDWDKVAATLQKLERKEAGATK
jgi:hypothetical protein